MALKYTVTLYGMRGGKKSLIPPESFDDRLKIRILNFLTEMKHAPKEGRFTFTSEEIQQAIRDNTDSLDFEMILYDMEQDNLIQPISRSEVPRQLTESGQETIEDPTGVKYFSKKRR